MRQAAKNIGSGFYNMFLGPLLACAARETAYDFLGSVLGPWLRPVAKVINEGVYNRFSRSWLPRAARDNTNGSIGSMLCPWPP